MKKLPPIYGLYSFHHHDSRILVLSENLGVLEWVRETAPKYELRVTINLRNLKNWADEINYQNCYLYKVSDGTITLKSDYNDIKAASDFCKNKFESYQRIMAAINYQRRSLSSAENFKLQDVIYSAKVQEARDILEGKISGLIFLNQEAEHRNVDLVHIANEVLLQHEIFMGFLARTESLRVRWLSKLRDSTSIEENYLILKDFNRELYEYHRLS
jgi:hypothetical protein